MVIVTEQARQQALDELIRKNDWRNGLSQGEQVCFEAGWDAAMTYIDSLHEKVDKLESDE